MDEQTKHSKQIKLKHVTAKHGAPTVNAKRLYTIKELVAEIGATEWFWRSQIWDGQLPYVQVGRKMFIDRNDIENFIKRNKTTNQ